MTQYVGKYVNYRLMIGRVLVEVHFYFISYKLIWKLEMYLIIIQMETNPWVGILIRLNQNST